MIYMLIGFILGCVCTVIAFAIWFIVGEIQARRTDGPITLDVYEKRFPRSL